MRGDIGRQLFIVKKGIAEVVEDEYASKVKVLAAVEKGGVFGEIALLHMQEGKRLRSVRAGEFPCEVVIQHLSFCRDPSVGDVFPVCIELILEFLNCFG